MSLEKISPQANCFENQELISQAIKDIIALTKKNNGVTYDLKTNAPITKESFRIKNFLETDKAWACSESTRKSLIVENFQKLEQKLFYYIKDTLITNKKSNATVGTWLNSENNMIYVDEVFIGSLESSYHVCVKQIVDGQRGNLAFYNIATKETHICDYKGYIDLQAYKLYLQDNTNLFNIINPNISVDFNLYPDRTRLDNKLCAVPGCELDYYRDRYILNCVMRDKLDKLLIKNSNNSNIIDKDFSRKRRGDLMAG